MIFESYSRLNEFSKSLNGLGADQLDGRETAEELLPYIDCYNQIKEDFSKGLLNDLAKLFFAPSSIVFESFHPCDPDAQGAGYIKYRISFNESGADYQLRVECFVFEGRVVLSFDNPEYFELPISARTKKILKGFRKVGSSNFLAELISFQS